MQALIPSIPEVLMNPRGQSNQVYRMIITYLQGFGSLNCSETERSGDT
jgi:hypothetical protein